jgi:hypothetical protein
MGRSNKEEYPWFDEKITKISRTAIELIGFPGRMLYRSKSMRQPTTIFNANIFNSRARKIWFGDLEIERDKEALLKLSQKIGPVYILYEMDGRFLEHIPNIHYIKAQAVVTVENGAVSYRKDFAEAVEIVKERIKQKEKP